MSLICRQLAKLLAKNKTATRIKHKSDPVHNSKNVDQILAKPYSNLTSARENRHDSESSFNDAREDADLYVSILQASTTKREAKAYLQRYKPVQQVTLQDTSPTPNINGQAIVADDKFIPGHVFKARNRSFIKNLLQQTRQQHSFDHFAEECFAPEFLEDQLHIALVKISCIDKLNDGVLAGIGRTLKQLQKLGLVSVVTFDTSSQTLPESTAEIQTYHEQADRIVAGIEQSRGKSRQINGSIAQGSNGETLITMPNLIFAPLSRGIIPVLPPVAYDITQTRQNVSANSILKSLTGMISKTMSKDRINADTTEHQGFNVVTLDRIIILDEAGGIPSVERGGASHIFINMQQEYTSIRRQLSADSSELSHLDALDTLRECLSILPATSSALITTPFAAASELNPQAPRNPLIHNLLTDKPVLSSSLPIMTSTPSTSTTLIKHGMPLLMLPSSSFEHGFKLSTHPAINLKRLVLLIEDSFGKKLDVDHYLARVDENIAGIIIAGDYDGGAIITWEKGLNGRRVPYLDKFAVARKSQGIGGVADVVFKGMVMGKDMFQDELVWRSRKGNPVNKWYFERSKGTYKLPQDTWTMFWTTESVMDDSTLFKEYLDICESVIPSLQE